MQVIQALLLGLALLVIILRAWARLWFEKASLTISEYFTWLGWFFALGWFICSTIALQILIKHPAVSAELVVNNVAYLKVCGHLFDGQAMPTIWKCREADRYLTCRLCS